MMQRRAMLSHLRRDVTPPWGATPLQLQFRPSVLYIHFENRFADTRRVILIKAIAFLIRQLRHRQQTSTSTSLPVVSKTDHLSHVTSLTFPLIHCFSPRITPKIHKSSMPNAVRPSVRQLIECHARLVNDRPVDSVSASSARSMVRVRQRTSTVTES